MLTRTVKFISSLLQPQKGQLAHQFVLSRLRYFLRTLVDPWGAFITLWTVSALLGLSAFSGVNAQTLYVRINIPSAGPGRIQIDARLSRPTRSLSFRNSYAGVLGLGERIESVEGVRKSGEKVRIQQLAPGEFEGADEFSRFTYDVNLANPLQPAQMSHVSSLNSDRGLLMMADLLPQLIRSADSSSVFINIDVLSGWSVTSNVDSYGGQFRTDDPDSAVFLVGPSLRQQRQRLAAGDMSVIMSGKWPLSADTAVGITKRIFDEHSRVTQFVPKRSPVVMLLPYSEDAGPESWSAETRGNVVVLLLGRNASGRKVLSRIGIVLSHELFHLWVPNSLKLTGDYDWFFEGFTLYQALRTDLRLGLISFDDYLETIASVYDSYRSSLGSSTFSLLEASERRWTTSGSSVYVQGMLVAFIYDLTLRGLTECGGSLDDVYAEIFRLPATGQRNANETIIKILGAPAGLKSFAGDYIESVGRLSLDATLKSYGIEVLQNTGGTRLVVSRGLNKSQRKVLGCVGYKR